MRINALALLPLVVCATACRQPATRPEVTVAAAANLTGVFRKLAPQFERQTGIHPVFSFASTAQLARQIENSAPFDVFAAADAEHVQMLDQKHLLAAGSRNVYAVGILALWIPPGSHARVGRIEDLDQADIRTIAVAKPELAPYGQATVETLRSLRLWARLVPRVVYAENISMAKQFGASGNADAVFTAYSLVLDERGAVLTVPENLHKPIAQELGIIADCHHPENARRFVEFLTRGAGRQLLAASGYRTP